MPFPRFRASVLAPTLLALAGCSGSASSSNGDAGGKPPYRAFAMIERWSRADPAANNTMTGLPTFHSDSTLPRYTDIDAHCGYHEGSWTAEGDQAPSFGTIHMQTPKLGDVTWTSDVEGAGYQPANGALGWDTGDEIRVTASGKDLPAFDLQDVVPVQAVLTNHVLSELRAEDLVIPRSQGFSLSWTPVQTEVFGLFLQFDDAAHPRLGILCFFPGETGSSDIPQAVLERLLPSSEVAFTNFYFSGASRKRAKNDRVDLQMVTWKGEAARVRIE